ncbi:MAG TPA: hypothetical protein VE615_09655 [Gaiellaceae bacterium]|jgi:hypothetical protein|nr:hypothetical protein [Gaiellaceae bacterium]
MRRRLGWLSIGLALAGCVGILIVLMPGRSQTATGPTESTGGYVPPQPEKSVRMSNRQLVAPLNVAAKFIDTAVARRNVAESWNILSPTFEGRGEYTKRTWAKGDIPVQSFPVSKAKWDLEHSFRNEVGLLVALFPPKGSDYRATVFKIDLRAFGKGAHRRWLVDYFGPVGTDNISVPSGGAAPRTGGLPDLNPQGRTGPSGRLNRAWLAVPIGILGMAVLFPIGFAVANVYRGRRAERNFAKTGSA